jgi:hypothetical protein
MNQSLPRRFMAKPLHHLFAMPFFDWFMHEESCMEEPLDSLHAGVQDSATQLPAKHDLLAHLP